MVPSPSVLVSEPSTEGEVFTVATPTGSAETAAVASVASSPLRPVTEQSKPSTPSGDVRGPVYGKASPLHASVKATAAQIDAAGTGKPLMPKVEQRAAIVPRETKFAQERIFDTAGPAPLPPAVVQTTLIKSLNIPSSVGIPEAFHIIEAAGTLQVTDLAASVRDSPLPFGEEVKVLPVVDKPEIKDGKKYLFHVIIKPISLPSETSSLMLVGSIPEFGAWDPTDGVELAKRGEETWEAIVEVDSDVGFAEYKYAIVDDVDGLVRWEQGENRTVNWCAFSRSELRDAVLTCFLPGTMPTSNE